MPYRLTAVRLVTDASDPRQFEEIRVLAEQLPDITEPIAVESAYRLAVEHDEEHVLLTALKPSGKPGTLIPAPYDNPLERRTVTMQGRDDSTPRKVTVDGEPPG